MLKLMNYLNGRVWTLASSFAALFLPVKFCLQFFLFVYILGFTRAVQHRLKPGVLNSFVVAKISVYLNLWDSNCVQKRQKVTFFIFLCSIWELWNYEAIVTSSTLTNFRPLSKTEDANFWEREVPWDRFPAPAKYKICSYNSFSHFFSVFGDYFSKHGI